MWTKPSPLPYTFRRSWTLSHEISQFKMYLRSTKLLFSTDLCLVLLQVPKCFLPVQIFWASPEIWLHLVPLQKLLRRHKKQFYWMQIIFLSGTKCLRLPQYVNKFLVWHKKFGPAQNILGPVKGQGISIMLALKLGQLPKSWSRCPISYLILIVHTAAFWKFQEKLCWFRNNNIFTGNFKCK